MIATEEEKDYFQTAKNARAKYGVAQKEFLKLASEGKKAEAANWLLVSLQADQEVWFEAVDSLIRYQTKLVQTDGNKADGTFQNARSILLAVAILSILLTISVAFWMTRSITKPVSHLVAVMQKMTLGDRKSVV